MAREKNQIHVNVPKEWTDRQTSNRFYEEPVKLAVVEACREAFIRGANMIRASEAFGINTKTLNAWLDAYPVAKKTPKSSTFRNEAPLGAGSQIRIPKEWKNRSTETVPWRNSKGKKIERNVYSEEVKIAVARAGHEALAAGVSKNEIKKTFCNSALDWMGSWPADHFGLTEEAPRSRRGRPPAPTDDVMIHVGEDGYKYIDVNSLPSLEVALNGGKARVIIDFPDGMRVEGLSQEDLQDFININ
jgi:hypothetical protein